MNMNPMNRAMRLFFTLASWQGLDLPPQIRDRDLITSPSGPILSINDVDSTTNGAYLELAAIAQHYGFPTMLLDWSLDPLCALYFAVHGSLEHLAEGDCRYDLRNGSFSVFALDASRLNKKGSEVLIKTYKHHTNRNLIAQKGLFTYVSRKNLDDRRTVLDIVDGLEIGETSFDRSGIDHVDEPVLIKLNVPYSDIIDAMNHLKSRFKTSDTFFPGYEGIVMAMKDHISYQIVKKRIEDELRDASVKNIDE